MNDYKGICGSEVNVPIGGYMELALADIPVITNSIWKAWVNNKDIQRFRNARSALVWLLVSNNCSRIWLPAYICESVYTVIKEVGIDVRWYSVGENLDSFDRSFLHDVSPGDAVLSVCYFGKPVSKVLADALEEMPDVLHIEDRAQALSAGKYVGDWVIFSPRKLVGVPDGGIAINVAGANFVREKIDPVNSEEVIRLVTHLISRFEDPSMKSDQYTLFQTSESAMEANNSSGLRLSEELLRRLPLEVFINARKRNWKLLHKSLSHISLWSDSEPDWAPMGFPIRLSNPQKFVREMAQEKIFCPRHWSEIPSPKNQFCFENDLSQCLVTLPCDHRFDVEQIERVVAATLKYQN